MKRLFMLLIMSALVGLASCGTGGDGTVESCASSYEGTFTGESSGPIVAQLLSSGELNIFMEVSTEDGDYSFQGQSMVAADGTITAVGNPAFTGAFDLDTCEASGTWVFGILGMGDWSLGSHEPAF